MGKQMRKYQQCILSIGASIALCFASVPAQAGSVTNTTKATAQLAASCQISAQNVNFGQINPQNASNGVTANSSMNLFCTTGSAYTISLAYGGVYGQGGTSTTLSNTGGVRAQGGVTCSYGGYLPNGQYYSESDYVYGTPYCPSTMSYGTPAYSYGVITGAMSGDTISYKITVPGNDSQVWNAGNYTYSNTGTGASQTFPIRAVATTSNYPTPDSYSDTVTATVSF